MYFFHVASSNGGLSRYVHGYPPLSLNLFNSSQRYVSGGTGGLYSLGETPKTHKIRYVIPDEKKKIKIFIKNVPPFF